MSTLTTGRTGAYLRSSLAAAARGLIAAFNTNKTSWIGLAVFVVVALLAIFAPVIAPHDPLEHTRRMLGLDGVRADSGRTRLKAIDGESHVIDDSELNLGLGPSQANERN